MVDVIKRRAATYQEVLDAPEHVVAEIVDGELYLSPRPAVAHARSMTVLGTLLTYAYDLGHGGGPGGWYFLNEPELHFAKDVMVPDIAAWRTASEVRSLDRYLTRYQVWPSIFARVAHESSTFVNRMPIFETTTL